MLEHQRGEAALPGVYSPHRGYGYLAVPPGREPALLVGRFDQGTGFCASLTPLASCVPRAPWAQLWPGTRTMR